MTRRTVAVAVLVLWLGALGWLARREILAPRGELLGSAALSLPPGAAYYRVLSGEDQVGFASTTVDTLPDTLRVTDVLALEVPVLGTLQRTDAQTEVLLSRDLEIRTFTAWLRSDQARFAAQGTMDGDTLLIVVLETPTSRDTLHIPLGRPPVLPSLLSLNVAFGGGLAVGRRFTLPVFDPILLTAREVTLTIDAESTFVFPDSAVFDSAVMRFVPVTWDTVPAWAVRHEGAGPPQRVWVDRVGQVVHATSPAGFTRERAVFELAYENFRRNQDVRRAAADLRTGRDIVRQTAIASNVPLARAGPGELRVRLRGIDLSAFDLAGGRQRLAGDTLIVTRERTLDADWSLRTPPGRHARFMQPEPLIQSDDPRIEAQARQVVGRTRNPTEAARRLVAWVHAQLAKDVSAGVPSAVDLLERRRGDCNEHTTLFVALARAVNIPARTAAGLIYLDGAFYYHAWPEIWLAEWVAVDPTSGQFPADAAHLRFTVGGLARQVELVPLLGRLSLEVTGQQS